MKPTLPKMDSAYTFIKAYRRSKGYSENQNRTFRDTRELLSVLDTISEHYEKHFVSKKNSDELRTVFSVSYPLREYQEFIRAQVLTPLDLAYTSPYAYAYRRGLSTKDNAKVHEKSRYMLKLDIRHFFESTRKRLVFATFEKYTLYNRSILGILTKLVCYNGSLCQGACTSPTIANLVLADFDASVGLFCDGLGIRYSRYCDDMTFSSPFEFDAKKVEEFVRLQLKPLRYFLNDRKTRFFRPGQRLEVTGAVVNTRVRAPREYRQKIRQDLYYIN